MKTIKNFAFGILVSLVTAAVAFAQAETASQPPPSPAVVVSGSAAGVRFAALGSVRQMRVEVFGASGDSVYNSGFKAGNVYDWRMEDGRGLPLPDGGYLFVVIFRDASGRVGMKQGGVVLQSGRPSFQLAEAEQPAPVGQERSSGAAGDDAAGALTLTAHDGREGQLVSTRGGLSFRAGDFFAGKERELMRLTPEGDVGVGVALPTAKLDVAGTIRARGGIQFDDGTMLTSAGRGPKLTSTSDGSGSAGGNVTPAALSGTGTANRLTKWLDSAGTLGDSVVTESNGFLGVGTTTPTTPLDVIYNDNNFGFGLNLKNTNTGAQALAGYGINSASGSRVGQFVYVPNSYVDTSLRDSILFSSAGAATKLGFVSSAEGGGTPDVYIRAGGARPNAIMVKGSTGFVGVGTDSPQSKLDVVGDLKVSGNAVVNGNIAAKYQDVAEWVHSRRPLAAGTVVVLSPSRVNTVAAASRAYDTRVAGVVSERPGIILGEGGEGKVMVATTGRVKVKVDATRHAVRVGDLLVTSAAAGVAMKSLPVRVSSTRMHRPGTIIGKALEPLPKGRGEILVLLTLQ